MHTNKEMIIKSKHTVTQIDQQNFRSTETGW